MEVNIISAESITAYLIENYLTLDQLANESNSTPKEIRDLVTSRCAPSASYTTSPSIQISSQLYASIENYKSQEQTFYSPSIICSIKKCQKWKGGSRQALAAALYNEFEAEFFSSLVAREAQNFGFEEVFEKMNLNPDKARPLAKRAWESFLKGIYGICVRGNVTADSIVRKAIAINRVALLTNNGSQAEISASLRPSLIVALREFDSAVSRFAPHDWPTSSRKRLFDDLVPKYNLETEFPNFRIQPDRN
ncbi:MAG: DUF6058 family natural product biosynthesis protein [Bdellovibrionales bacterium]